MDEDVGILELGDHLLRVRDEVRGEVAAVELHALDDVELGLGRLGLLDRDDALVAHLLHGVGDHLADLLVAVGGDRADLGDLVGGRDLLGSRGDVLHGGLRGEVDAALQVHRVDAGGDVLGALADDGLGQHGRGGRAVTRDVVGLRGHFAHHLGAHVLELVGELDLLGDRHTVLGDARGAEALLDHDVAALRAQRHLHRVGEDVDAAQHLIAGVGGETNVFRCHGLPLVWLGSAPRPQAASKGGDG
ncbi:hypothetical protein GOFOIKOB_6579 [Methylobacterium tardum]|nr:hypothetical protein GOFOIKOB_6579 [Methylobacterium tardum]